ncbi:MAG: 2-dehydropantoate 2-reductase [Alphaproteobacteria bacterium]|jgi:2-dehydropantoate 2-reductase|nr:2-dehydropantoate 2-reductase [Alphaproteobacteria bacterium]
MKVCVVGAGSIGGLLAARLSKSGCEVSAIARGPHLTAIQEGGLRYRGSDLDFVAHIRASDKPADLGPHDFVILTVKAPSLPEIAPTLAPLCHAGTSIVSAMNGIPWWFSQSLPAPLKGRSLRSVDPDDTLSDAFPQDPVLGCVVHAGSSVPEPGLIDHSAGDHFIVGSSNRTASPEAAILADALTRSGLTGVTSDDIHGEIWMKLIGNMGMGPISALTGATLAGIARDMDVRPIAAAMMQEAMNVGEVLGLPMTMGVEARIDLGAELGEFKPSILQDLERGRPMEIDALVTVVAELGEIACVPTPTINTLLALLRGRARLAGLY